MRNNQLFAVLTFLAINWVMCTSLEIDALMPNVSPQNKDTYLCHKIKLNEDKPVYITEFQPKSTKEIAHHILLFGCSEANENDIWSCGEMKGHGSNQQYEHGSVCKGKQNIIYAWAMDAPKLVLPDDVAFEIGGNTDIKYLILQVHYANVDTFKNGGTDNSGIVLIGQEKPTENLAGVYLLETSGYINAHSEEKFEAACEISEEIDIYPFAYRTHAHKLGVVNSGYVVKTDQDNGEQEWIELARRSPQLPQMFYPVPNKVSINKGDIMTASCTMDNERDNIVKIGATGDDEMCNVYIMYYGKANKLPKQNICFTAGPPHWYFKDFISSNGEKLDMTKIPEDISDVPDNQAEEMSDMNNHHNMHMDSKPQVKKSDYNYDDIEKTLKEIQRDYFIKKLLEKYDQ